jgi:hypothetical protein
VASVSLIEVDHPDHDEEQRAYYHALAERLDLAL